jgi:hypothetical protein
MLVATLGSMEPILPLLLLGLKVVQEGSVLPQAHNLEVLAELPHLVLEQQKILAVMVGLAPFHQATLALAAVARRVHTVQVITVEI